MVAPASGATEISSAAGGSHTDALIMWMMAQLDKEEESERRQHEAAGAEGQQTANKVAAVSVEVGAATAAGCRDKGPTNNEVKVERRQQRPAAGSEDRSTCRAHSER